ncbi:ABC transporter permease [Clostridium estertheticum]|uniref:ABC transporter permease n=1 Tax=Clostridium estertheticum TaxID=238834 RepID=UPI001C0B89EE|nr:autoinducer 2 import system permease LsrD [Clostridium estertheticum]MBU3172478.1 autoinducer 2 import system permease LsrD [Clostridium estertheticum]MBW9173390.1 autoinducer 2 import system permease LsrD [Clostridium estertheticum]WLC77274.1 autoinducer 2 import system permease LsrD [Clostridium estertheticum]
MKHILKSNFTKMKFNWELFLVVFLIVEVIIFGALNPNILRLRILFGSINDFISIGIIAVFMCFVFITGGIDLQAGSIVGLTSIIIGVIWKDAGVSIYLACFIAIISGCLCGALSGFFIAFTGVQPMVVTLGGSFLFSGIAIAVSNMSNTPAYLGISGFPECFTGFTKIRIFSVVPVQLLILLVFTLIAYIILHRTKYGRKVFLCGINQHAAEFSGINTKLIIMSTYIFSGMAASFAGIIMTSYLGSSKCDFGGDLTMPLITAVILGGTSILGGKGSVVGSALAAIVIGILRFGLSMVGMSTQYLDIPVGIMLVVVVALSTASKNQKIYAFIHRRRLALKH